MDRQMENDQFLVSPVLWTVFAKQRFLVMGTVCPITWLILVYSLSVLKAWLAPEYCIINHHPGRHDAIKRLSFEYKPHWNKSQDICLVTRAVVDTVSRHSRFSRLSTHYIALSTQFWTKNKPQMPKNTANYCLFYTCFSRIRPAFAKLAQKDCINREFTPMCQSIQLMYIWIQLWQ